MPRQEPVPYSWPVAITENGDGTVTIRYAYGDGKAANIVIPANRHNEYDHAYLSRLVRERPPAPTRPGR